MNQALIAPRRHQSVRDNTGVEHACSSVSDDRIEAAHARGREEHRMHVCLAEAQPQTQTNFPRFSLVLSSCAWLYKYIYVKLSPRNDLFFLTKRFSISLCFVPGFPTRSCRSSTLPWLALRARLSSLRWAPRRRCATT